MSRSRVNWSWIEVWPVLLVDVITWIPAMVENSRSSGVATADAIVSGLAVTDTSENGFALGWDEIKLPNPLFDGDQPLDVTVSIGGAAFPQHGATPATLMRSADQALYVAKAAGRDRWHVPGVSSGEPVGR